MGVDDDSHMMGGGEMCQLGNQDSTLSKLSFADQMSMRVVMDSVCPNEQPQF